MKFVPPIAHQLAKAEDRIELLTKSNCDLQEEIRRLRVRLARATIVQPQKSIVKPSASVKVTRSSTSEEATPSYARTTKAFRLRSSSSRQSQTIAKPSKSPLPVHPSTSGETIPSHARLTESASLRSSSSSRALGRTSSTSPDIDSSLGITPSATSSTIHDKDCTSQDNKLNVIRPEDFIATALRIRSELSQMPGAPHSLASTSISSYSLQQISIAGCAKSLNGAPRLKQPKMTQIASKTEGLGHHVRQEHIASRTRLADKAWINRLYFKVHINHDSLFKILSEAQDLAKECVWTWVRINHPQCLGWLGYLSDVDFSRDKFHQFIQCMPISSFAFGHSKPRRVRQKLYNLVGLRNLVCHFNGAQDVRHMDVHLETVHELAVLFYDEPRAILARALRDRLREEAERTLQEIEILTMLTTLPNAGHSWLLHHKNTVRDAVDELGRGYHLPCQRHPILDTGAREWTAHHMGWEYGAFIPIPKVKQSTVAKGGSSDEPKLLNAAVSERRTGPVSEEDEPDQDFVFVGDCMLEEGEIYS